MANDDFYNKKQYKTEQGIEKFHNVKYEKPNSQKEFIKALEELDSKKYNTLIGERSRIAYFKKNLKITGTLEIKKQKFESLVKSFLLSISKNFKLEDIDKNMYQIAHDNIHKIIYIPGERFSCTWIYKDIIYRDEFKLNKLDKFKSKILVMKSMKCPFELSRTSLNSTTIRIMFKNGWKRYIKEIERGINII